MDIPVIDKIHLGIKRSNLTVGFSRALDVILTCYNLFLEFKRDK